MFDQILGMVKEHVGNSPQVEAAVPEHQREAVNQEIAQQLTNGMASQAAQQGGIGGLLSKLQGGMASGSPITSAIEGGVISSIASKFGLPPAATGAIAAALPGLLQKFAQRANDPNDHSITHGGLSDMFSKISSGGLGNLGGLFGR